MDKTSKVDLIDRLDKVRLDLAGIADLLMAVASFHEYEMTDGLYKCSKDIEYDVEVLAELSEEIEEA